MAREIEAMLRLARIEEGLSEEQRRPVDVAAAVDHVASFFDAEAEEAGARLEVAAEPGLRVLGDPEWIQTALSNLVSNAIKYGGGRGTIRVQARSEGRAVRIEVSDEGPGIPTERLEEVFERFGRAGPAGQRPGFGLGLPITREIAHAHGGRVDVTSGPRRGTTFTMTLPALD